MTQARNLSRLLNKKLQTFKYTATLNQTSFADSDDAGQLLSYTPDNMIVTYNGVVLENGSEYTATNGSTVVLSQGADSAAEVNVYAFESVSLGGYVPITGGTFGGDVGVTGNLTIADKIIHSGDTNTSIRFPAADTVTVETAGTERLRVNSSGDVGIGVTPNTWASFAAMQLGDTGCLASNAFSSSNTQTFFGNNVYYDGAYKYIATGSAAAQYLQIGSEHRWNLAPSGTAGNAITFTQAMTLDASGRLLTPSRPAFRAHTFTPLSGAAGTIIWTVAAHNIGSHYNTSTGLFTAPVAGVYQFDFNILMSATSATNYIRVLFLVNGSYDTRLSDSLTGGSPGAFTNYTYHAISLSQSFYLAANDTVGVRNDNSGGSTYATGTYGSFSGYLVG